MRSRQAFAVLGLLVAVAAAAAQPAADFASTWKFMPAKSRNLGMMAALEVRAVVEQTATLLSLHEKSTFQGQESSREVRYDLSEGV